LPLPENQTVVFEACRLVIQQNVDDLEKLLSLVPFDISVPDADGNTIMHYWFASSASRVDRMFFFFLSRGVDLHARNHLGQTPFDVMLNASAWLSGRGKIKYPISNKDVIERLCEAVRSCRDSPLSDLVSQLVAAAPQDTHLDARMLHEALGYGILFGYQEKREGIARRVEDFRLIPNSKELTFNVRTRHRHHFSKSSFPADRIPLVSVCEYREHPGSASRVHPVSQAAEVVLP
jgi:hypothetical protein